MTLRLKALEDKQRQEDNKIKVCSSGCANTIYQYELQITNYILPKQNIQQLQNLVKDNDTQAKSMQKHAGVNESIAHSSK